MVYPTMGTKRPLRHSIEVCKEYKQFYIPSEQSPFDSLLIQAAVLSV